MDHFSDQEQLRRQRRQDLIDSGQSPYPSQTHRSTTIASLLNQWADEQSVIVAGRVTAFRLQGGSAFLDIADESGQVQAFFQSKKLGPQFNTVVEKIDLGDFLEIHGQTFVTKRGEKTVDAKTVNFLGKALRPLPSKWHGLEDVEMRYRFRELDLISHEEVRQIFRTRAKIITTLRSFLDARDFLEVETPMLQPIPGGANARPFITHHHTLDSDFYLRVAPELYLKRLVVGGYGRVYEIARCFRNEGIDREHNPEFTQIELYAAYADYTWMMSFIEELLTKVVTAVHPALTWAYQGQTISWKTPLTRLSYRAAILDRTKIDIDQLDDRALLAAGRKAGTDLGDDMNRGQIIDEIFKTHVRPTIIQPTFVLDYPLELSPLAKQKIDDPRYTERFQLLMGGTELANAFSELNDPIDQRERFEQQEQMRQAGDTEAQRMDTTFLQSLEYGLPPTAGLGMGLDRLTALLTDQRALKEVILFPTLKPEA